MEAEKRILVADAGEEYRKLLVDILSAKSDLTVVGETGDGCEVLRLVKKLAPDVLVTDLILSHMDGVEVLKKLKEQRIEPQLKTLVISGFICGNMAELVARSGADYFLMKPCRPTTIIERIRQLSSIGFGMPIVDDTDLNLQKLVTSIIREIKVPVHIMGYRYLREAIIITVKDMDAVNAVTKVLYPEVAKRFSTTSDRVERSIHHAIEVAWDQGDLWTIQKYFGNAAAKAVESPTNSEFIATIADRLQLQLRQAHN